MDLLSTIRKEGSRGGVDFKWDDVKSSVHRENYMGHSLMAPVGRWQKGRDLNWYAKGDSSATVANETMDEKKARERKEEIRRIKEAEEDALARALGLPVPERKTIGTDANSVDIGEMKRVIKETEAGDDEIEEVGRGRGFGDFVGITDAQKTGKDPGLEIDSTQGGLLEMGGQTKKQRRPERRSRTRSRNRSRSRERRHRHHRHRSRSRETRDRHGRKDEDRRREEQGPRHRTRSRSPDRRDRRHRSRSHERQRERRDSRERGHSSWRDGRDRRERSWSPRNQERRGKRYRHDPEPKARRSRSPIRDRRSDKDNGRYR